MAITRRRFLRAAAGAAGAPAIAAGAAEEGRMQGGPTLFLCGDVMLGRGIDQILPHPVDPELREPYVTDARVYLRLAERAHGEIPRAVGPDYVWGDALEMLHAAGPAARIVNLETSVTTSASFWPKAVNYRMSPRYAGAVLAAAKVDCCVLANNHVLDFGRAGLVETLETLERAGLASAGAGRDAAGAAAPARLSGPAGRIAVFAYGTPGSGIPPDWAAAPGRPGVNLLPDLSEATLALVLGEAAAARRPGDLLVASIHWGGNWGHAVPAEQVRFARGLIEGGFDLVHGHSAHHVKAFEIHRDRPILYGCGDFITDYEGISGHEAWRGDIAIAWLPTFARPSNALLELRLVPFRMRRFRLERPPRADLLWLGDLLARECARFGVGIEPLGDGSFLAEPR